MRQFLFCLIFLLACSSMWAQDKEKADELVTKGIELHDKGDFKGAINLYEKALEADANHLPALAEMAISNFSLKDYDKVIELSKLAIDKHPGEEDLMPVFVIYGSALDMQGRKRASVEVYEDGIKQFPESYMLYFNKGVTLAGLEEPEKAMIAFQKAAMLNPRHAGTQNAIGRSFVGDNQRVPAVLALLRFMILEATGERAAQNYELLQRLFSHGASKGDKKGDVNIVIDSRMLADTLPNGEFNPDGFVTTDLVMTTMGALEYDKKHKNDTPQELMLNRLQLMIGTFEEVKERGTNFAWKFYVPYFVALKKAGYLETISYIITLPSENPEGKKWVKANEKKIDAFYKWSSEFPWPE